MDAEHYRRYAKACFELAGVMTDLNMQLGMIEVARGWLRLSEQYERNRAGVYDPPVKNKQAS
jgi:hypothetical protein